VRWCRRSSTCSLWTGSLLLNAPPRCACVLQVGDVPGQAARTLRRHHHAGWQQEQALNCSDAKQGGLVTALGALGRHACRLICPELSAAPPCALSTRCSSADRCVSL
jgi:hypothetical protein